MKIIEKMLEKFLEGEIFLFFGKILGKMIDDS